MVRTLASLLLGGLLATAGCTDETPTGEPADSVVTETGPAETGGVDSDRDDSATPVVDADGDADVAPSFGQITGVVVDRDMPGPAYLAGVKLSTNPATVTSVSDPSGRFRLGEVPAGTYELRAEGMALKLVGTSIVLGDPATVVIGGVTVAAGKATAVRISLPRLAESMNLVTLMDSTKPYYTNANCIACHTDRKDEASLDPAVKMFHALPKHSTLGCVSCHATTEIRRSGWDLGKGIRLSKNATVRLCAACHVNYPASYH
jgi:hypothetical protein